MWPTCGLLSFLCYFLMISVSILNDPTNMAADLSSLTKVLFRLRGRAARYCSHREFLTECINNDVVPKGMKLKFGLQALPKSEYLLKTVSDTLHRTEKEMLIACRDTYKVLEEQTNEETNHIMYDIFNMTNHFEFEEILGRFNKKAKSSKRNKRKKQKKLKMLLSQKQRTSPSQTTNDDERTEKKKKRVRRFKRRNPLSDAQREETVKHFVVNLSDVTLTKEQTEVLTLGPKFCPTPQTMNRSQLADDVNEGLRKVKLKELFFESDEDEDKDPPKFYKPTGYDPPAGRNVTLDAYCGNLQSKVHNYNQTDLKPPRHNMTKEQRDALKELKEMVKTRVIRISSADKGGAVVVQNCDDYVREGQRQLNNPLHYRKLQKDTTPDITEKSNTIVKDLERNGHIDKTTAKWAMTDTNNVQCHRFYTLPKIHKSTTNTPGRPIVSGVNGPTEKLSKLVDHWLQDSVKEVPSYVQDTTDMLNTIEHWNQQYGPFPENTKLVTIDVVGLYTNIPHGEMKDAIREHLNCKQNENRPPTETVVEVAEHVLDNNVFAFEDSYYQQTYGTAMGTPMAPSVANLFMASLEEKLINQSPVTIQREFWKRFIDDIFLLWTGTDEELATFMEFINSFHQTIKFTYQSSSEKLSFLDVSVSLENGFLQTDLFTKPTDSHAFLCQNSCHPAHVKRNLPYSQFLRLRRLCSGEGRFQQRCDELERHLYARGYGRQVVRRGRERASAIGRREALTYKAKPRTKRVPFVVTHNPLNPPLGQWLHEMQETVIKDSEHMKKVLPEPPICGERNCKNIRNILMPTVLPPPPVENPGNFKCSRNKCIICKKHLVQSTSFTSCRTGETFQVRGHFTCDSKNIIYLIVCKKCNEAQYVGETKNTLRDRFYPHRSTIGSNTGTPLTMHFNQADHSLDDMGCMVIEQVSSSTEIGRMKRESFWITKLRTLIPDGLNADP